MAPRREDDEMTGYLPHDANLARLADMRLRAGEQRRAHPDGLRPAPAPTPAARSISIRCATEDDRLALQRLAALDSVAARPGDMLIAAVDDEPQAAIHVASGTTIADPFRPTAELVELLSLRAARLRAAAAPPRRGGLRARLRAVLRAA
jgi:hypothetical protein